MKKILIPLALLIIVGACKKEGSGGDSSKLLLSKVMDGGLLKTEYIYSSEGRLIKTNIYTIGGGLSKLSYYFMYDYNDDGTRKQEIQFNQNTGVVRRVFTYDAQGRISRVDRAIKTVSTDNIDDVDEFEVFEYNDKGQLVKITRRELNQAVILRRDYSYDDKGNLVHSKMFYNDNGQMEIREDNEITPGDKQMPGHWKKLLVEPEDMDLYEFFSEGRKYTSYFVIPTGKTLQYSYPNRVRNGQGLVTSETIELQQNGATIISADRTYEYIESKSF